MTALSACPADDCPGFLVECPNNALCWRCTINPHVHHWAEVNLASCTRCDDPEESDRLTIAQALNADDEDQWLNVSGEGLACPAHLERCFCGTLTLRDSSACAGTVADYHCPECSRHCPSCLQDAADEARFSMDRDER